MRRPVSQQEGCSRPRSTPPRPQGGQHTLRAQARRGGERGATSEGRLWGFSLPERQKKKSEGARAPRKAESAHLAPTIDEFAARPGRRRAIRGKVPRKRAAGGARIFNKQKDNRRETNKKGQGQTHCVWLSCGRKACVCVLVCAVESCDSESSSCSCCTRRNGSRLQPLPPSPSLVTPTATPRPCRRRTRPRWARPVESIDRCRGGMGGDGGEGGERLISKSTRRRSDAERERGRRRNQR